MLSGTVVTVLGLLTFLPLYVWIYNLQAVGKSPAAIAMPEMHIRKMDVFWAVPILQASGLAALIWSYWEECHS